MGQDGQNGLLHGTNYRYNQGCRCAFCTEAHRVYSAEYRKQHERRTRAKAARGPLVGEAQRVRRSEVTPPLGTLACYCWCMKTQLYVRQELILEALTASCGREECKQPPVKTEGRSQVR